ncbi:MAG TPA: SprT family zinc-dependent metalloprotease [Anaerolineales bacterium]|nr:SprT family zinc-dependent metalloprotease [Anaerolineales bacterium]
MSDNGSPPSEERTFWFGESMIDYRLILTERQTLAISVTPDKEVIVRAPAGSRIEQIEAKLLGRGNWILKQINYFDRFHPIQPERQYVSGETHYYLGRQYRLRIRKASPESVRLVGKFFIVHVFEPEDRDQVAQLMKNWYADHAPVLIERRAREYTAAILGAGHRNIVITYQYLDKQWGIRSADGSLTFNIELVKTPIDCIDYVIVHELCHLVLANHDKAFYRLLRKTIPDWEARKDKLERFGAK